MNTRITVAVLAICAVSDLAAVPLLIGSDDAPVGLGLAVGVLGVLTLVAALGLARGSRWARPLAIGTRSVDALAAIPAFGSATGAETAAAVVTVVLSVLAIGLVALGQHALRTA